MMKSLDPTTKNVSEIMERAIGCCLKQAELDRLGFKHEHIVEVAFVFDEDDEHRSYDETDSFSVFRTTDDRWWAFEENGDSSGHGCQCGFSFSAFPSREEAIRLGLSERNRETLNETQ